MPSLLVYIDPSQIADVLGPDARTVGRRVPVSRSSLPPQIERLEETSTLFVITVERGRALVIASIDEPTAGPVVGTARIHEHDITDVIARLGCEKVWEVPQWANIPRVLQPGDVTMLRWTLGMEVDDGDLVPASVSPLPTGDPLAAIVANPASDAPRRDYAAQLEERGDPRGELIALQLARVERGDTVSERERTLVAQVGDRVLGPLALYLESFALERGFLARCRIAEGTVVPEAQCAEPVWGTVEDVATVDPRVLTSPALTAARIARVDGRALARMLYHDASLTYDTLLPYRGTHGIALSLGARRDWDELLEARALPRLRALSLDGTPLADRAAELLASPLAQRLAQLDVWVTPDQLATWRAAFDASRLPVLTLRFALDQIEPVIALERRSGPHRLVVELRATVSAAIARDLAPLVETVGRGLSAVELVDTSLAPFAAQQPDLLDLLAPRFPAIELRRARTLALG